MEPTPYNWQPEPDPPFPTGRKELLFAMGALLCGMLLCNVTLFGGLNLGFAIAVCCCVLCSAGYLLCIGSRPDGYSTTLLVLTLVTAAGFGRSDDGFVKLVLILFLLAGAGMGLCLTAGKNLFSPGRFLSLLDAFSVPFVHGIGSCSPSVRGLVNAFRQGGETVKKGGALALGLAIAAPVLAVTVFLLVQADAAFHGLVALLPDFDAAQSAVTVLLGVFTGIWLYSAAVSLGHKPIVVKENSFSFRLNPITVNTVLACLCTVYGAYLFSQLAYFSGGFAGILPQGYSLSEYARRGFFEMALLSGLNLLVVTLLLGLVKKEPIAPFSTRLLCLFLGLVTLFLVASASAKMLLYIDSYGLTRLRVLTQIVMLFLAVTMLVVMVWMFLPRLQYMKAVMLTALLLGALTIWTDVDTQVARYNVDAYLTGKMEQVDTYYLSRLNSGAVPHIARLAEQAQDPKVTEAARALLRSHHAAKDFRGWNYADAATAKYEKK